MHTRVAIIPAAGFGRRLDADEGHKLMATVDDRPLLAHHVDNFSRLGIQRVIVVTGYRADYLRRAVTRFETPESLKICCAYNPDFDAQNGLSVLAGARLLHSRQPFWLVMSDHLFDPAFFDELAISWPPTPASGWQGALFVDRKLDTIFDMPDATKVRTDRDDFAIGKELNRFDAVDAGLFWCAPGFVEALRDEQAACGDCSTSDAVRRLVEAGRFGFVDIGEYYWQDVDTPEALHHAEKLAKQRFVGRR